MSDDGSLVPRPIKQVAIVVGEMARPALDFKRLAVSPSE